MYIRYSLLNSNTKYNMKLQPIYKIFSKTTKPVFVLFGIK